MNQEVGEGYEQLKIDTTLDIDRDLKENTATMIKFAYEQMMEYKQPSKVKNKHEGYGIVAEAYSSLAAAVKNVRGDMDTFLKLLPSSESDTLNICGSLYNSAAETGMKAIMMAAQCQRILNDLYYGESRTPIELAIDATGEPTEDGFEEAGEGLDLNDDQKEDGDGENE